MSVAVYLCELIEGKTGSSETGENLSSEERVRLWREWASSHSLNSPILSSDAINRGTIYSEHL